MESVIFYIIDYTNFRSGPSNLSDNDKGLRNKSNGIPISLQLQPDGIAFRIESLIVYQWYEVARDAA